MFGFGLGELVLVLLIVTFVFGRRRIPELARQVKESIGGFRKGIQGEEETRPIRDVNERTPKD